MDAKGKTGREAGLFAPSAIAPGRAGGRGLLAACLLLLAFAVLAMPAGSSARAGSLAVPVVSGARLDGDSRRTRFIADLSFAVPFNVYVMAGPYRVMIDLPEVDFRLGAKAGEKGRGLVRAFRYGRMGRGKARIVIETAGPALIRKSYVLHPSGGQPARLVVDLVGTDERTFRRLTSGAPGAAAPAPRPRAENPRPLREADPIPEDLPVLTRVYRRLVEAAGGGERKPAPSSIADLLKSAPLEFEERGEEKPASPRRPAKRKKPLRAAGGKRKPLIVIDPGHGGKDPGAPGVEGVYEKHLVLRFARALRDALRATGRFRVALTRDGDHFLTLRERVKFARRRHASLFISIHADKFRTRAARGAAIYTLSEKASDEETAELARAENAADVIDGVDLGAGGDEVKGILIDLTMRETKNNSVFVARGMARELRRVLRLRAKPVRSADFRVLRDPDVPSVLVELGYVSNPSDLANMRSARWRKKTAAAMTRAVKSYFSNHLAWRK